jgi:hypothetical protein
MWPEDQQHFYVRPMGVQNLVPCLACWVTQSLQLKSPHVGSSAHESLQGAA